MADPIREEQPNCFGKLWDPKAKECVGGMDPAFTDESGSHVRQKCIFFETCGTRLQASRMESARGLLDPRSLVKNSSPVLAPAPQTGFVERFVQSVAQKQVAVQPYSPLPPQVVQPRPQAFMPQQQQQVLQMPYGYQQMMPVNYQMPGYLSVPEMRQPDQSFFGLIMRTVVRSMGKSIGHSVAHLFDTVPLGHHHGNGGSHEG